MSFRRRMTLFFLLIVVVPMVVVAFLVTQVTRGSSTGKADARLSAGLETALKLYRDDLAHARDAAAQTGKDSALAAALRSGDRPATQSVAARLAGANGLKALTVESSDGRKLAAVGGPPRIAPARIGLTNQGGGMLATMVASTTTPAAYLAEVRKLTGDEATLGAPKRSDVPPAGESATIDRGGEQVRAASARLPGSSLTITMATGIESGGFFTSSPLIIAALVLFFGIAFMFIVMLLRVLQGQVAAMLGAARGIGEGDFSQKVPVVGRDEMAGLAAEFNKMSDRLSAQMDELQRQRVEIDRSVRRIGVAFASGLDRDALLRILTETALSACDAKFGRIVLAGSGDRVEVGDEPGGRLDEALTAAEERATGDDITEARRGDCHALASALRRLGDPAERVGTMSIARSGEPFSRTEEDVFRYLIGQLSASIENIALHELVSEQAITDELTGLSNNRHFRDVAGKESARAERFGHDLSLLMLDIDDFKQVNDTYGHPQGDAVLAMIGEVLAAESRGVDEPARYGGEEFVVMLPETGLDGAAEVAERIRSRIERQRVPREDGERPLQVTASVGVAAMPDCASDLTSLISAADQALYAAKGAGKNRVERATADGAPSPADPAQGRASVRRS